MLIRVAIMLVLGCSSLIGQACEIEKANAVTCLTLEYVRALAAMAQAEKSAKDQSGTSDDPMVSAFYAVKTRMNAERLILVQLRRYGQSRDKQAADAAHYVVQVFSRFFQWDSTAEINLRRVVAFKSSVGEMEELSAEQKVHGDQLFELIMAGSGSVLDASVILEGTPPRAARRGMTLAQRDFIVTEIERAFAGHLKVESDSLWYSGWAAAAASMRSSLLDPGWKYSP